MELMELPKRDVTMTHCLCHENRKAFNSYFHLIFIRSEKIVSVSKLLQCD